MSIAGGVYLQGRAKVLLVEDEAAVRRSLQLLLQGSGYEVRAYADGLTLLADETSLDAACLVADHQMEICDGMSTLSRLRERGWDGAAILITGYPSANVVDGARVAGFDAVFEKPLRKHALVKKVEELLLSRKAN